jgi:N-acetylglucosamine kinase-like BadF-type ATPase
MDSSGDATSSARPERLYLGIDGGGTKTRAVVVDDAGVERGAATTGCSNYKVVGAEAAIANLLAAARQAGNASGHDRVFAGAWIGAAGIDGAADLALLSPALGALANTVRLTNDAELLLAALPNQVGIALIAGTGSNAVGRNIVGTTARTGGWGHLLGDEGSGYALGQQSLIAALRALDGRGQPTLLCQRILAAWGVSTAEELADRVYREESAAVFASLAPSILQAARDGDPVARRITRRAALELASMTIALARRLGYSNTPISIALGGSLLLRDASYRDAVLRAIEKQLQLDVVALVEQPELSAARAAIILDVTGYTNARSVTQF